MRHYHFYQFIRKHLGLFVFGYGILYLLWFRFLEETVTQGTEFHIMHCVFDDLIPFVPAFIIPYLLWFFYIGVALFLLYRTDIDEAAKLGIFLASGMTVCLMICTLYPNGINFRIHADPTRDPFSFLTWVIQCADTPTNVFPSIHAYNAIGVNAAIWHSRHLQNRPAVRMASLLLMLSICCSTVFLKQHSVLDVVGAGVLAYFIDWAVYGALSESVCRVARATGNVKETA